jgi:acetylornithine deacetylase
MSNHSGSGNSRDELLSLAQALVRHPSEQSDLMEGDPAVISLITDVVAPWLSKQGIAVEQDGMGNLVATAGSGTDAGGPHLLFVCYAMTHPAGRMTDPFRGEVISVEGAESLRGRGVSEQKGAMAAALLAFAGHCKRGGSKSGRLSLAVTTAGETGRHDAAASVVERLGGFPDHAVIVLGTGGSVAIGNKGRIDVVVEIEGRSSHSSTPERGIDAIRGARAVMDRLDTLPAGWSDAPESYGRRTITVTAIESFPKATHTIQDRVRMVIDRRLVPGDDPDAALEEIRSALSDIGPYKIGVQPGPVMYPALIDEKADLVQGIRDAARAAGTVVPGTMFSQAALDAGFFQRGGAQAVMWGPGDMNQFHADEEHVPIDDLMLGMSNYAALIEHICGKSPDG